MTPRPLPPFVWTGRDIGHASLIAFALSMLHQHAHADAILETSVDLQGRTPRNTDAWRFWEAGRFLTHYSDTSLAAQARAIGSRIALAVTGFSIIDCHRIQAGASDVIVFQPDARHLLALVPSQNGVPDSPPLLAEASHS